MFSIKNITIPTNPGCYIYRDSANKIIYIGKAKNLRKRVQSYFRGAHDSKTTAMIQKIADVEFIITDTEVEALILEAKLIFQHKPQFNLDLKDTIRYAYIKITDEEFPRIISTRTINRKKDTFFGPYPDGTARRNTVYTLNKIFQLRTCKKLPKNVCLLYHIGQCTAPCEQKISKTEYNRNVQKAKMVLKGNTENVIRKLEKEMYEFSKKQNFEQAKIRRDQITALHKISQRQKMSLQKSYNQDYINFLESDGRLYIQLFNVQKGIISGRKQFDFEADSNTLNSFIRYYYYSNPIPEEIVVPTKPQQPEILVKYLSQLKGSKVKIAVPIKGTKKKLLELLFKNLELNLSHEDKILHELKDALNLQTLPRTIECFDISNIGPQFTVGSMVHFKNGQPDKNNYRRFKIKTVQGQNDFAMMAEVVRRRYSRLKKEDKDFPDLILIDGGPGQLGAAFNELQKLELSIPIISIAKKEEILHFIGERKPLRLSHKSDALKLLQRCRDEAHRFGLKYHRLLRSKGMLGKK